MDIANTRARNRVAAVLRQQFRHSLKVEPSGAEWIETGAQSAHLAELALRLVDAVGCVSEQDRPAAVTTRTTRIRDVRCDGSELEYDDDELESLIEDALSRKSITDSKRAQAILAGAVEIGYGSPESIALTRRKREKLPPPPQLTLPLNDAQ